MLPESFSGEYHYVWQVRCIAASALLPSQTSASPFVYRLLCLLSSSVDHLLSWLLPLTALIFTVGFWIVGLAVANVWPQYHQNC